MFICAECKAPIGPEKQPNVLVIETRPKVYPARYKLQKEEDSPRQRRPEKRRRCIDRGGKGFETVKEIRICDHCHRRLTEER